MAVSFLLRDIRSSVVIPEIMLVISNKTGTKVTHPPPQIERKKTVTFVLKNLWSCRQIRKVNKFANALWVLFYCS